LDLDHVDLFYFTLFSSLPDLSCFLFLSFFCFFLISFLCRVTRAGFSFSFIFHSAASFFSSISCRNFWGAGDADWAATGRTLRRRFAEAVAWVFDSELEMADATPMEAGHCSGELGSRLEAPALVRDARALQIGSIDLAGAARERARPLGGE
jgi:hypothetical protein